MGLAGHVAHIQNFSR